MFKQFAAALVLVPALAVAQQPQKPANEQVVVPQVDRREIKLPKFPSKDFSIGAFGGTYASENFGSNPVAGLKLGYHISEDIFVEAAYGQTKVSDQAFRQILPGGVFREPEETLTYWNLSAGYNILPGEVFIGRSYAMPSQVYLIGGIGSTKLADQRKQTLNVGLGLRVFVTDRAALQVDLRDHFFSFDLLGKQQSTQNLELTAGFAFFF